MQLYMSSVNVGVPLVVAGNMSNISVLMPVRMQ